MAVVVLRQCTVVLWRGCLLAALCTCRGVYIYYVQNDLFIYLLTYLLIHTVFRTLYSFIYLFIYSCISRVQYMAESTKEEMDTFGMHVAIDAGFSVPSRDLSVCGLHCEGS